MDLLPREPGLHCMLISECVRDKGAYILIGCAKILVHCLIGLLEVDHLLNHTWDFFQVVALRHQEARSLAMLSCLGKIASCNGVYFSEVVLAT